MVGVTIGGYITTVMPYDPCQLAESDYSTAEKALEGFKEEVGEFTVYRKFPSMSFMGQVITHPVNASCQYTSLTINISTQPTNKSFQHTLCTISRSIHPANQPHHNPLSTPSYPNPTLLEHIEINDEHLRRQGFHLHILRIAKPLRIMVKNCHER